MNYLTITQAAESLGMTRPGVHYAISHGKLSAFKNPQGVWYIDSESLEEYANSPRKRGRKSGMGTEYVFMNREYEVARLEYRKEEDCPFYMLEILDEEKAPLLTMPPGTEMGKPNILLWEWWCNRSIPKTRVGLAQKLRRIGVEDISELPFAGYGASLSDQYWLRPADEPETMWEDINFFHNYFESGKATHWSADWTGGLGSSGPDSTTNGNLPKKWACDGEMRVLLKGSDDKSTQYPYNEVAVAALLRRLLAPGEYVEYWLEMEGPEVVSACPTFVSDSEEFVPAWQLLNRFTRHGDSSKNAFDIVVDRGEWLGIDSNWMHEFLSKMVVCDFLIANQDRHYNNFGFVRDVHSGVCYPAPLFDNGSSLWFLASDRAVSEGLHRFGARPFAEDPYVQLDLVTDVSWLDIDALDGYEDELEEILGQSGMSPERFDYVVAGYRSQLNYLLDWLR